MWVIDLENPAPRLRGLLARWGVEIRAGMYVGSTSAKARDAIWALVEQECRTETSAVMVYDTTGPQGFELRTHGPNRREVVDVDGLWLARFRPREGDAAEPEPADIADSAREFAPWDVDEGYLEP